MSLLVLIISTSILENWFISFLAATFQLFYIEMLLPEISLVDPHYNYIYIVL